MRREHRFESNGWSEESGSHADEKKAEMVGTCGTDGGSPYSQVSACVQASWRQALMQLVARRDDVIPYNF